MSGQNSLWSQNMTVSNCLLTGAGRKTLAILLLWIPAPSATSPRAWSYIFHIVLKKKKRDDEALELCKWAQEEE